MASKISAHTGFAAVLGHPVTHSLSPAMHNAAFSALDIDAVYLAMDVGPGALESVVGGLREAGCLGLNLTLPHKSAGSLLCDEKDDFAVELGAVNTIVFREGKTRGYNTDAPGFLAGLGEAGVDTSGLADRPVVVLGGGGAARAVCAALRSVGAQVQLVVRNPGSVDWIDAQPWETELLQKLFPSCSLLVDATSIGVSEQAEEAAFRSSGFDALLPLGFLSDQAVVHSLIYHRKTELLARAEKRSLHCVDGLGMLLHQGAEAFRLWTGKEPPIDVMRQALLSKL